METMGEDYMKRLLSFHVPPEARPSSLHALLAALSSAPHESPVDRSTLLGQMAQHLDVRPRSEVLTLAHDLGIISHDGHGYRATPRAQALERCDSRTDLVHGMQYFAWSPEHPKDFSPRFTYRQVTDLLWEQAPVAVNPAAKKRLVEEVLARIERAFAEVPEFDPARISIGPKSVDGVVRWLEELSPPVVQGGIVTRRQTCPPLLLVYALGAVARTAGIAPETDFRLTAEHRSLLCRCCFIEPESLDRMLEWTVTTQPKLLRWGTLISAYGRQLVLKSADLQPEGLL